MAIYWLILLLFNNNLLDTQLIEYHVMDNVVISLFSDFEGGVQWSMISVV
jgi:hypothetical protein